MGKPPKSSILIGFTINYFHHPFWDTPIFGSTPICTLKVFHIESFSFHHRKLGKKSHLPSINCQGQGVFEPFLGGVSCILRSVPKCLPKLGRISHQKSRTIACMLDKFLLPFPTLKGSDLSIGRNKTLGAWCSDVTIFGEMMKVTPNKL